MVIAKKQQRVTLSFYFIFKHILFPYKDMGNIIEQQFNNIWIL